jgi:uncharacterized protein with ParB-like and HNH nuclease domain
MTVDVGIHNHRILSMQQLFNEGRFQIPYFQREYSWSKDHWTDFFADLNKALDKKRGHFFGFITLRKAGSQFEIIEGQQRMTTVITFLCTVRDLCIELGLEKTQNKIEGFISQSSMVESHLPPTSTLTLSHVNRDFFKTLVEKPGTYKDKEKEFKLKTGVIPSNKLIFDCYKYFHQNLSQAIEGLSLENKNKRLLSLSGTTLEYFIVSATDVSDHLVAYNMFQTINDRGLDLTLSDLLKLYICSTVTNEKQFIEDYWDEIRDQLVSGNMNNFLRHYWLSSYGVVKESLLLSEIRDRVKDEKDAYKFMEELGDEVETYEALIKPTDEFWNLRDPELIDLLKDLQILSPTIPLPLLLAGSRLDGKEFAGVIKFCTIFIFRYLTIGEQESKVLEKIFSDLAIKIRKGEITKATQVRERFLKEDLDDKVIESILESKDIKLNKVATYILKKVEEHLASDQEKFSKKITLEHILPKTPDQEWEKYMSRNDMDHHFLVDKLGNQTLLLGRVNTTLKNRIFSKKTEEYKKSSKLEINKKLVDLKNWTTNNILERQKWLAKQCLEIWKL